MKGAVLALFCAVALVNAEINENGCPINPYEDVLLPHPNCNKYYQCVHGDLLERKCAETTAFNVETQACDQQETVDCGERIPVVPDSSEEANDSNSSSSEDSGAGDDSNNSSDSGNDSGNNSGDSSNSGENGNPSEADKICAAEGSEGVLVAHENCNQFYKCDHGVPVAFDCWGPLVFNPSTDQCDWPDNVNCDRNNDGGNGDSGNGDSGNGDGGNGDSGNGDSGSGDSGNGDSGNGDSGNGDSGNGDSGNGDSGNGDGGNGDSGNGDNGSSDNDSGNAEAGGNGNPSEAPKICAAEGSDGVLVAHENCNQFYKCSEGVPVALDCWGYLQFNPSTDQCDWPENVDCGNRSSLTSFNKHMRFRM